MITNFHFYFYFLSLDKSNNTKLYSIEDNILNDSSIEIIMIPQKKKKQLFEYEHLNYYPNEN